MKKFLIITIVFLLFILSGASIVAYLVLSDQMLLQTPILFEQRPVITFVIGNSYYRVNNTSTWKAAIVGTKLDNLYEVKTEKGSIMDIKLHDNTAIRLTENSELSVSKLNVKKINLFLTSGSFFGKFERLHKNHDIGFTTPTTVAAIRGTEMGIEVNDYVEKDPVKLRALKKKKKMESEEANEPKKTSTEYTLAGIVEVMKEDNLNIGVLVSNQNKVVVDQNQPPSNPQKMTNEEIDRIQKIINSLHFQEVLLITDKIYFPVGSADILKESYPELDKIATILKKRDENIMIEGHTDSDGEAHSNQKLSVDRANSIRNYLINKGADKERFEGNRFRRKQAYRQQ